MQNNSTPRLWIISRCATWLGAPSQHYLRIGSVISVLLHVSVFAWSGEALRSAPTQQPALEMVLLNAHSEATPDARQVLAQNQMDGGGNAQLGLATTPLPQTGNASETILLHTMRKRQAQLEAEQNRLLTQLSAPQRVGAERQPVNPWPDSKDQGQDNEVQDSVLQNSQIAALAAKVHTYNAQPRKQFVAPSAHASRYAAYLDAWRTRIETIGTQYYPEQARGRLYGWLRITISVRSDGSIADLKIDQPSPHAVLNLAARRIAQMAAPFPPFPPDIARDTDVLVITRSWHFVNDTLETQTP